MNLAQYEPILKRTHMKALMRLCMGVVFFYAWPLFFPTFFYDPPFGYVIWGILLSFLIIPIFVFYHGSFNRTESSRLEVY